MMHVEDLLSVSLTYPWEVGKWDYSYTTSFQLFI